MGTARGRGAGAGLFYPRVTGETFKLLSQLAWMEESWLRKRSGDKPPREQR